MSTISATATLNIGFNSFSRAASVSVGESSDKSLQEFMHRILTLDVGVLLTLTDTDEKVLDSPRYMYLRNLSEDSFIEINGSSLVYLHPGDVAVVPVSDGMQTLTAMASGGTGGRILEVLIVGNSASYLT